MTAITSLTLTSPTTSGSAAFTVGQGFRKGDIPAGLYLTTDQPNTSCIPLATWNDGSLKHARIVGSVALTANTPLTVNLSSTSSVPVGSPLTESNIVSATPSASVQCGSLGTVNLSSLLGSPVRSVASTPNMVECHYRAAVPGTNLLVWFHVRLFANNAVYIRAIIENGYLDNGVGAVASNADVSYVPIVTIGDAVVYNNGGAALTHCQHTRWKAEGWIGTDPQVTPKHDGAYLRASRLAPNFSMSTPSNAELNAYITSYVPMSTGGNFKAMATGGANPAIGILTEWDSAYVQSGDPRAFKALISASDSLNSFGIVWRDFTTKDVIKPNSFATWSIYGPNQGNDRYVTLSNGNNWEINHHPGLGYGAYLLTGDYWHYETMMLQLSLCWVIRGTLSIGDAAFGSGTGRVLVHETRGGAWSARTMSIACGIMPDSEKAAGKVGAEYRELLANNVKYWKSLIQKPGINQLGFLYEYAQGGALGPYGPGLVAGWQQSWWIQADGFGSDLEPLTDMTDYIAVRNYRYKAIVGMLGDVTTGFPFDCLTVYRIQISAGTDADPTTWYSDWRSVAVASFAPANNGGGINSITHTNALMNVGDFGNASDTVIPSTNGAGGPADAWFGRWGYYLPAIAYAAEHGAPGAAESWARITGASNYSTLTGSFTNQASQWGILPRSVQNAGASVMHAVGPAIRFGRMRSGRITISKYHGNGIPASAIPSTGTNGPALLYNDIDTVNDPVGTVYRLEMANPSPASGTFTLNEDSSFSLVGAADGNYTSTESVYKNGVLAYTSPFSATIGTVTATVTMVTVSPLTPSVAGGSTQQFSASVIGTNSPAQTVTWTTSAGSINASTGLFTAPAATSSAQMITVTATSTVDTGKSGTATVTVPALTQTPTVSSVSVSPSTASLSGGAQQTFMVTVSGTNNPAQTVTWTASAGTINSSGVFTAPAASGSVQTITITARSTVDSTKTGAATATVAALSATVSSVSVSPSTASVGGNGQQQFSATVSGTNSPAQSVTWSATGGSITSSGLFTAPATSGSVQTITVRATSTLDGTKYGSVTVTIPALAPSVSSVSVSPSSRVAQGGTAVQLSATVNGLYSPPQGVTWSTNAGSITSGGLWTAPARTISDQSVTISAASTFDPSKVGTVTFIVPAFATPDAPLAISATAGMETATVTITAPADDGGTPVTGYIVTVSNGQTQSVSGTSATFSIPAFTPVSFTAQAVNVMGAGAASSPSNTVIARPVESTNPADYSLEPAPRGRSMRS